MAPAASPGLPLFSPAMPRIPSAFDTPGEHVVPDGMTIRRRRRRRGWSRRDLVDAIARASFRATGREESVSPSLLRGIEEENEATSYEVVCLISAGLDCNPVELLAKERPPDEELH